MASESLISALAANWDGDGRAAELGPVTLRTLALGLRNWMQGTSSVDQGPRIAQLRASVAEVERSTRADLENPLAPDLEAPLRGSLEVYEDLLPILDAVARAYAKDNRNIEKMVELLDSSRAALLEYDQAMEAWLRAPVLRCPRCGNQPQGHHYVCARCQADMLIPDPESALSCSQTSASMGPEYVAVFEALSLVVKGEGRLSQLMAALGELEEQLGDWAEMAEDEESTSSQLTYALDTVADASRRSLEGAAQMRRAVDTRQTRDLNEGWLTIFNAHQEIQTAIPTLAKAAGGGDHYAGQGFQDSVSIEGD